MSIIESPEYRQLALDSSNDMIEHDASRGLGRYAQAAMFIRQAGVGRARMGRIMFDAGQFARAAEDWLSAAACFYLASAPAQMNSGIELVRDLDRKGHIPPERRDLRAALKARRKELRTLEKKLTQFDNEFRTLMLAHNGTSTQETLDFLVRHVRDLPGLSKLHAAIAQQALQLGQPSLANQHLEWARKFDSGIPGDRAIDPPKPHGEITLVTPVVTDEYRQLGYETSNDMIRHDTRRLYGEYEESALHIRLAGIGRARMGKMMYDAGQYTQAAEDWLAAAACFYLASDGGQLKTGIELVRELDHKGYIPPERRDIRAELQQRMKELRTLEETLIRFVQDYRALVDQHPQPDQERLDFLRKHVRELPGFADLHFAIYQHARALGQASVAGEHLGWAAKFNPNNPEYVGRYGYELINSGQPARAVELAREFILRQPTEPTVRITLAQGLISPSGGQTPDLEGAMMVLQPVLETPSTQAKVRLGAIVLAAGIQDALGREVEYRRLLDEFDRTAAALQTSDDRTLAAELRRVITRLRTNGEAVPLNGSNQPHTRNSDPCPPTSTGTELLTNGHKPRLGSDQFGLTPISALLWQGSPASTLTA